MKYLVFAFSFALLAACGADDSGDSRPGNSATENNQTTFDCVPSREEWDSEVQGVVETHCGTCHGESPNYGAPHTLTSYDSMMEPLGDARRVDRSAARVAFGTMPPAGIPDVPDDAIQTFVDWASCGEIEPELGSGLKVDRPVFLAPEEAPEGLDYFDVRADEFAVGEDVLDLYQCFSVDAPVDSDQFIRRLEVVVDQSEVIHHVVLLRDPERNAPDGRHRCPGMPQNSDYLYAWAPGGGPIEFPDGGLRVTPGERFVLQIHYNNSVGRPDVVDTSGVRLFYDEPTGEEYGMVAPGPLLFQVAPSSTEDVSGTCQITQETRVLAGMPHMHEIGQAFEQVLERADGTLEPVISLQNWEFETQLFYSIPMTLMPGDELHTTCTFDNPGSTPVRSGEGTSDEMCFNFMYVTPPPVSRYCNDSGETPPSDIAYEAGVCMEEPPIEAPRLATGSFVFEPAPTPQGGELTPGVYELNGFSIYRDSAETPIGNIDAEASELRAKGQLVVTESGAVFDARFLTDTVSDGGQRFSNESDVSIAGPFQIDGGAITFDLTCPEPAAPEFGITAGPDAVTMQRPGEAFGVGFIAQYTFERVE